MGKQTVSRLITTITPQATTNILHACYLQSHEKPKGFKAFNSVHYSFLAVAIYCLLRLSCRYCNIVGQFCLKLINVCLLFISLHAVVAVLPNITAISNKRILLSFSLKFCSTT